MEQRRFSGKGHWYHETQSNHAQTDVLPLVPEAANVDDRFLLDLALPDEIVAACSGWLTPARALCHQLFPLSIPVNRLHTLSAYDRLSTALTVAQSCGVQRLCNHYAALLARFPARTPRAKATAAWHRSPSMPASSPAHLMSLMIKPGTSLMRWACPRTTSW